MTLDLANYEEQAREAVKLFWGNREAALARQVEAGNVDAGARGAVTAGKNMGGFLVIAQSLIEANGLKDAQICVQQRALLFRPHTGKVNHLRHKTRFCRATVSTLNPQHLLTFKCSEFDTSIAGINN